MNEYFAAAVTPNTINDAGRTVDVIWYTSVDVPRQSRDGGRYIRRFDPTGADLSLLNSGAPVLDNHNCYDGTEAQKGVVEKAWRDGMLYKATLRFSKRPSVDGLWTDIRDKVVQKFSMGTEILSEHEIADQGKPIVRLADKWRPFEISLAPLPADWGTTTLSGLPSESGTIPPPPPEEHHFRRRNFARMGITELANSIRIENEYRQRQREIDILKLK